MKCEIKDVNKIKIIYGLDWSDLTFDGIDISKANLRDIKLNESDYNFFQNVKGKYLDITRMPKGDYSKFNFDGVRLNCVDFTDDTIMPTYSTFLKDINYKDKNRYDAARFTLTINMIKNIHMYELDSNMRIDLTTEYYKKYLCQRQLDILKNKYPDLVGKNIILPKKVYGDDLDIESFTI